MNDPSLLELRGITEDSLLSDGSCESTYALDIAEQQRKHRTGNSASDGGGGGDGGGTVKQRSAANARERDRTHSVNTAFSTLRTLIPTEPADRKLSKIETLRLASSYIAHLATVLMAGTEFHDQPCLRHQLSFPGEPTPKPVCTFCLSSAKKAQRSSHDSRYFKRDLPSLMLVNTRR